MPQYSAQNLNNKLGSFTSKVGTNIKGHVKSYLNSQGKKITGDAGLRKGVVGLLKWKSDRQRNEIYEHKLGLNYGERQKIKSVIDGGGINTKDPKVMSELKIKLMNSTPAQRNEYKRKWGYGAYQEASKMAEGQKRVNVIFGRTSDELGGGMSSALQAKRGALGGGNRYSQAKDNVLQGKAYHDRLGTEERSYQVGIKSAVKLSSKIGDAPVVGSIKAGSGIASMGAKMQAGAKEVASGFGTRQSGISRPGVSRPIGPMGTPPPLAGISGSRR